MSSANPRDPDGARAAFSAVANQIISDRDLDRIKRLGMSPRQQWLNFLWSFFTAQQYEARSVDWDGSQYLDPVAAEAVATRAEIPPGFYDAADSVPLKMRRPPAPYHLARVIVKRFTGLLFSQQRHPRVTCQGDPATEDYVGALAEVSRLWSSIGEARNKGGACGSVPVGFVFTAGKPQVQVHDPRWCFPKFADRSTLTLTAIEIRYMFGVEERIDGVWKDVPHWYRRVVDRQADTVWEAVPVGEGDEPDWSAYEHTEVKHGFGFCPVRWIQNSRVEDDVDGEPDCLGVLDMIQQLDTLLGQAIQGIGNNCDPTVVFENTETQDMPDVKKGSFNAINLPKGTGRYMEIAGTGPKTALEAAQLLRAWVLEVAQCVLEDPDVGAKTATEIERRYSSMLERADTLREQYGVQGVLPLLDMMLHACRVMAERGRGVILPPKRVEQPDGKVQETPRELPPDTGGQLGLVWPGYFTPSLQDMTTAIDGAAKAVAANLIDLDHAVKFIARYFGVDNVTALITALKKQAGDRQAQLAQEMMQRLQGGGM